ncbi:Zn-dependent hydrolase [Brevibacillus sp. SYSU BS000544]|uniref:Zn-dependent hydrolase n=1 Tax=Brevibacillus sp. SYSU BS000544 TaxID=3416443 RepID=UPI003CE55D49
MNIQRLQQTLQTINEFGATNYGITRLAYTQTYKDALNYFIDLCEEEKLSVRVDSCGNVIARREGEDPNLPVVACGSHMDTVIQGGGYDGTLGVVAALEVIRSLNEENITTKHPIELIVFACEESTRFGVSTIGSKAMTGLLDKNALSKLKDRNGVSIQEAFEEVSLDFQKIDSVVRNPEEFKVFLELHIEQGPVLEAEKIQVGIVTGIAAPTRLRVQIKGKASHSGTTPMNSRQDALAAAAEIILAVEEAAIAETHLGTVGTVGACNVLPGAMNVIPDSVTMLIEVRGTSVESKDFVITQLYHLFSTLEQKRGVTITPELLNNEKPVLLQQEVVQSITKTCEQLRISYIEMGSGAGHDSMNMALLCPTGLIFIPCKDGLSHHPDEFTSSSEMETGVRLLKQEILHWAIEC